MWCIEEITPQYRERMYQLLDLYKADYDPVHPLVCMDKKSKQLLQDSRQAIVARPGSLEKYDYEYKRRGTCNIFMAIEPKGGFRYTKVTPTRKKADFAHFICGLAEKQFPRAEFIQLVMDNLNTHFEGSLLETFGQEKTEQLMKKLRFIYTPKHGGNRNQHHGSTMYWKKNSHPRRTNRGTKQMDIGKKQTKMHDSMEVYTTDSRSETR